MYIRGVIMREIRRRRGRKIIGTLQFSVAKFHLAGFLRLFSVSRVPTCLALGEEKRTRKKCKRLRCRYLRRPARKIELLDVFSNASRNLKRLSRQLFRPCCSTLLSPSLLAFRLLNARLSLSLISSFSHFQCHSLARGKRFNSLDENDR